MIKPREIIESLPLDEFDSSDKSWRLKLDKNENIYGASNVIISAMKNMDYAEISKYPGSKRLINKLSDKYNRKNEELFLTNGFDEAIRAIITAYLDENREILSYEPVNPLISKYAKLQNSIAKEIKYSNLKEIENEISDNTKIVFLETPNATTGELKRASEIEIVLEKFPNVLFVIDCAYINFAQNVTFEDYLDLIDKFDNAIIIKSFSFDYALAGLRLNLICSKEEIINNLKKVSSNTLNTFAVEGALAAFSDEKFYEDVKNNNQKTRELLYAGLKDKGFKPYKSETNFILCDFGEYADFYYKKFKNNSVIVKKFPKSSDFASCLRITTATVGGIKFLLELLNQKDVLIFNPDCVIFDIQDSFNRAIAQTVKHFANKEISSQEITHLENLGGFNHSYDIIRYLLEKYGYETEISEIEKVFQNIYYAPGCLINEEKMFISKETLDELYAKYDMVLYSERTKRELEYSLKKFDIDKYFCYTITTDDKEDFSDILTNCPYTSIKFICSNIQGVILGNSKNIETIGIVPPDSNEGDIINNFKHLGAKNILKNVQYIVEFLDKNEQSESALV